MRLIILGAGPGGYVAAIKAAQLGTEVIVIEEREVGGTCLNLGCIPSKALVASAEALSIIRKADEYGVIINGEIRPDFKKIMERKDRIISTQVKGIRSLFKHRNIKLVEGRGELAGGLKVRVKGKDGSEELFEGDRIIIATGSRPAKIPGLPVDGINILSSDDVWKLTEIPKSMVIIGAGVIGCQFACLFRELGTDITMVEIMNRALSTEDEEISDIMEKELKKKKIKLLTSVKVESCSISEAGVSLKLSDGKEIRAEKLLVSIGRALNSENIGLEKTGIEKGTRGEIKVNERMETSEKGIYAVGDVTGGMLLAHVASREGIVAAINACGGNESIDYSVVPISIYTSPEIASVGLREYQAKERGIPVVTGTFPYRALGKAHAMGEISGIFKIVADGKTDRVLGVHIIGAHASDIIHEAALAIKAGLKVKDIANMIHAHPTLSEGLMEAAEDVYSMAIHLPPKNRYM
ncbi:MAG: dihydrolipoyl dehydrogenase [Thermodesulfovibrionales bacterium]|nr:dihydrolipoyl dehydrogenase [Thermodesulfovibrionales bacterium]